MEYVSERITNVKELEHIIDGCYAIAQLIEKEFPRCENSKILVKLLKTASEFELHIEQRKINYCE